MLILNSRWTSKKHIFRKFSKFSPFYKGIQIQVMTEIISENAVRWATRALVMQLSKDSSCPQGFKKHM